MFSVIICSASAVKFPAAERRYAALFERAAEPFEIIHIPDARSMSEGYNRAAAKAKGDALLFSHDDVELFNPAAPSLLRRRLRDADILGVAGTTRISDAAWISAGAPFVAGQVVNPVPGAGIYNVCIFGNHLRVAPGMQALDGCVFATTRAAWERVRFDEETFDGFHGYDVDFTFSAFRAGLRLSVCCDLHVFHDSIGSFDATWKGAAEKFVRKHAGALAPPAPPGRYRFGVREAFSKQDAAAIMTPPWWPPEEAD